MKRVFAAFLICALLLGPLPTAAWAANEAPFSGTYKDTMTWTLSEDGTLTVSGTGVVEYVYDPYEEQPLPWDEHRDAIRRIVLEEGITGIDGEGTFGGLENLQSVSLPKSLKKIGYEAFMICPALTSVTVPAGVTEIGERAFGICESLVSIAVDGENPCFSSVDGVLCNKEKTEIIQYPSGRTDATYTFPASVTRIGNNSFGYSSHLTGIAIPNGVTSIGSNAFDSCENLAEISIAGSVAEVGYGAFDGTAFYADETKWNGNELYIGNCLIRVKEEQSGAYAVRNGTKAIAGGAFYNCSELTSIAIPDSVVDLGDWITFDNCRKITELTIPGGVTKIGDDVFSGCDNLERITLPDNLTSIGHDAFWVCRKLAAINIPDGVTEIKSKTFYCCAGLTDVVIPGNVTAIGDSAFQYCEGLTGITIPRSVTAIGQDAFDSCDNLTIRGYTGSCAETYAKDNNIPFHALGPCAEHTWDSGAVTSEPACTYKGEMTYSCTICGKTKTEEIDAFGHTAATVWTTDGNQHWHICTVCGAVAGAKEDHDYDQRGTCRTCGYDQAIVTPPHAWNPFVDVDASHWFHDNVKYVYEQGLMVGTDGTHFSPNLTTSRAMIATIIWRLEGSPAPNRQLTYTDCDSEAYYAQAVAWGTENGVLDGYGGGEFGPDDSITRQQLAAMLWRYIGKPKSTGTLDGFNDSEDASGYAADALCWAVEQSIIQGKGGGVLDPAGNAIRAEAAAMLERFCKFEK